MYAFTISFTCIWNLVSIWCHFPSAFRISFHISYSEVFCWWISIYYVWKVLPILKDILLDIVNSFVLFIQKNKAKNKRCFRCSSASDVFFFCLAACKIFSSPLVLSNLMNICLGIILFVFLVFGILWSSWNYGFIPSNFKHFYISSNNFVPFGFSGFSLWLMTTVSTSSPVWLWGTLPSTPFGWLLLQSWVITLYTCWSLLSGRLEEDPLQISGCLCLCSSLLSENLSCDHYPLFFLTLSSISSIQEDTQALSEVLIPAVWTETLPRNWGSVKPPFKFVLSLMDNYHLLYDAHVLKNISYILSVLRCSVAW